MSRKIVTLTYIYMVFQMFVSSATELQYFQHAETILFVTSRCMAHICILEDVSPLLYIL